MKTKYLRIGNLLMLFKDTPSKVIGFANGLLYIQYNDTKYFTIELEYASPIPLTEEWILKFGFEKKKDYYNRYYFSIDGMDIRIDDDMFETEVGESLYKRIKYVHQLQNLYFALNDKELNL